MKVLKEVDEEFAEEVANLPGDEIIRRLNERIKNKDAPPVIKNLKNWAEPRYRRTTRANAEMNLIFIQL